MPIQEHSNDLFTLLSVFIVSSVASFISITQRILRGAAVSMLWIVSEFAAALLCGYLTWGAYPALQDNLPDWFTMPFAVATAAHLGGRLLQALERKLYQSLGLDRRTK